MATRTTLGIALVLASLALPGAVADETSGLLGYAEAQVAFVVAEANAHIDLVESHLWPAEEEPAHEEPHAAPPAHGHASSHEHGDHGHAAPAPREEPPAPLAPALRPLRGLVPLPDLGVGAAPRLDLEVLARTIDEVAPTPAPARARGSPSPTSPTRSRCRATPSRTTCACSSARGS
ncbi:MAG TPA: hypothetical protein VFH78_12365 [Candidatus Thermoplasmatota archaeon]|nr:hypothetical protein [Candidatus Thermoplasmatota archaeon]